MPCFEIALPLTGASPRQWDGQKRIEQILNGAAINSVAEDLPPFNGETPQQIRQRLTVLSSLIPGQNG
jgi:hypothetical protein